MSEIVEKNEVLPANAGNLTPKKFEQLIIQSLDQTELMSLIKNIGISSLDANTIQRYRQAKSLSQAQGMIPDIYIGKPHAIYVGLEYAEEFGCKITTLLNNIIIVKGRVSFYADFLKDLCIKKGLLKRVEYEEITDDPNNYRVRALGILPDGQLSFDGNPYIRGTEVSMEMARFEDWTKNKKYKSMGEHMLQKRASTFMIRSNFSMFSGVNTVEELDDVAKAKESKTTIVNADSQEISEQLNNVLGD